MESDKDIGFVASRYRKGAFSTGKAWRTMGIAPQSWWSKSRIAAAVAGIVFLSATATVIVHRYSVSDTTESEIVLTKQEEAPTKAIKAIDFDNASLITVVAEIKRVYGVEVANIPTDAASHHLTLHYEGNVIDLVERINDILETNLEIRQ